MMIDGWKNKGLGPSEIPEGDARAFANGKGRQLYQAYQDRLTTLNACDFGDLLLPPDPHLPRAPTMCSPEYHRKFKYILVDEYQDTNTAQYMWLQAAWRSGRRPPPPRGEVPGEAGGGGCATRAPCTPPTLAGRSLEAKLAAQARQRNTQSQHLLRRR